MKEALYVLRPDADDPSSLVKTPIDLSALREHRVLRDCHVDSQEESSLFVQLAIRLDDGEAASLAIATHRSWTLATDDRVAANLARELSVHVVSTPQLVKRWASHTGARTLLIRDTIRSIQTYARFAPRQGTPEYDWWQRFAQES